MFQVWIKNWNIACKYELTCRSSWCHNHYCRMVQKYLKPILWPFSGLTKKLCMPMWTSWTLQKWTLCLPFGDFWKDLGCQEKPRKLIDWWKSLLLATVCATQSKSLFLILWYCVCSLVDSNDILEYFYDARKCEGFTDWNGSSVCKITVINDLWDMELRTSILMSNF